MVDRFPVAERHSPTDWVARSLNKQIVKGLDVGEDVREWSVEAVLLLARCPSCQEVLGHRYGGSALSVRTLGQQRDLGQEELLGQH